MNQNEIPRSRWQSQGRTVQGSAQRTLPASASCGVDSLPEGIGGRTGICIRPLDRWRQVRDANFWVAFPLVYYACEGRMESPKLLDLKKQELRRCQHTGKQ